MYDRKAYVSLIALAVAFVAMASYAGAQQKPLLVIRDSAWTNTGVQSTPPAALIMSAGVCVAGPNCNDFGNGATFLNPLTFYPSTHAQTVTITSAWGSTFNAFANVFAQGGTIDFWVPQVLTDDGLAPSGFPQGSSGSGGFINLETATVTVTSVEIQLTPFTFQETSGGWWVVVGNNGNPPLMNISVYGTF